MKGDYSRHTFDSSKHYTRVLMQQGRVQMDADWNEQVSNLLHYLQTLAKDLIGEHGTPADTNKGFMILAEPDPNNADQIADLSIGAGRYYVNGILCEQEQGTTYYQQPDYPLDPIRDKLPLGALLVYLDVWERHITEIEDPHIRDVALGGADTAARAKIIWQVKVMQFGKLNLPVEPAEVTCDNSKVTGLIMSTLKGVLHPGPKAELEARAKVPEDDDDDQPCIISPEAKYRGTENQLYRVEIHRSGLAGPGSSGATFKWSRENGGVSLSIRAVQGNTVTLDHLGRDERFGLEVGDWVELVDDASVLRGEVSALLQVEEIDRFEMEVKLSGNAPESIDGDPSKHPLLRRWDHQAGDPAKGGLEIANDGAAVVVESATSWLNLENGVQIRFSRPGGNYHSGDYWIITARTATGDVELRVHGEEPQDDEIEHPRLHQYAPLAIVWPKSEGAAGKNKWLVTDLRHFIRPAATCCPYISVANELTIPPAKVIHFEAQVANISAPTGTNLTYKWEIVGGTPAAADGPKVDVTADNSGMVVAKLTVGGLPLGCPQTAQGVCLVPKKAV